MEYKPSDLFIGVIDLFAIVLPGAVVSFAYMGVARNNVFGHIAPALPGGWQNVAVFGFVSYLAGHFMFVAASRLDKWIGDPVRHWLFGAKDAALLRAVKQLKWKALAPRFDEARITDLAANASPHVVDQLQALGLHASGPSAGLAGIHRTVAEPAELDADTFHILDKSEVIVVNAFQWAKAVVDLQAPAAAAEINRLEADSKFFRSLIVAAVLVTPYLVIHAYRVGAGSLVLTIVAIVAVMIGSLWRYVEQRQKSIRLAYTYALALGAKARTPEAAVRGAGDVIL
jgi:hypothetical protein